MFWNKKEPELKQKLKQTHIQLFKDELEALFKKYNLGLTAAPFIDKEGKVRAATQIVDLGKLKSLNAKKDA